MDYDITNEDRQGLQECLLILIDDYIDNNIKLYSNEKFLTEVYVAIFDITKKLYCIEIVPEFIIRSVLNDSMSYYFKTVGIPRSDRSCGRAIPPGDPDASNPEPQGGTGHLANPDNGRN